MGAETDATTDLFDPRRGDRPLGLQALRFEKGEVEPPRTNLFRIVWVSTGRGAVWVDATRHVFQAGTLLFFAPYQRIRFELASALTGTLVEFHANFLCVETFHAEVGCSSVLFADPYGIPSVKLPPETRSEIVHLLERIASEHSAGGLAHEEVCVAYLRVLLVLATRTKLADTASKQLELSRHPLLGQLQDAIEANYRRLHSPSDYARLLHVTPKTLGRIVKEELGKTLTALIQDRVLVHAKWELLHTLKPVKEIAHELGFNDELYFSRLFRKQTGMAPTAFRSFETEIREGSNLSMRFVHPPMLARAEASHAAPLPKTGDKETQHDEALPDVL